MTGTFRKGYPVPGQKLTEDQAEAIRSMKGKCRLIDLADYFGVSEAQISRIQNGKRRAKVAAFKWPRLQHGQAGRA